MRLFQGGCIASSLFSEPLRGDVLVSETGIIEAVGEFDSIPETAQRIDCHGKILVPGMFDMSVHSRDPGSTHKEDLVSCLAAARSGGITGMALMPDTTPAIDNGSSVRNALESAADLDEDIKVVQMGAITKGCEGTELAAIAGMIDAGTPMLTDSSRAVSCPLLLKRAMEYSMEFDIPIASRGDTLELSRGGVMNEGTISYRLGLPGIPSIAEEIGIERDIRIAGYVGGQIHIQQVSTAAGMGAIQRAKEEGKKVTCEVSPHHLLFDEADIGAYNTIYKTSPPLRTAEDRETLLSGIIDGSIDVIATNHSPHTFYEKNTDFGSAPFGMSWLDTALIVLHDEFIANGVFGWDILIQRFSDTPRKLMKLDRLSIEKGQRANFLLFDPDATTRVSEHTMASKSSNTPLYQKALKGAITQVVLG